MTGTRIVKLELPGLTFILLEAIPESFKSTTWPAGADQPGNRSTGTDFDAADPREDGMACLLKL